MKRRGFLQQQLAGIAGWSLAGRTAYATAAEDRTLNKLVVIMLRGGVDGLSVAVPHTESEYLHSRDTIALAAPGKSEGSLLPLDARFGLHPALARLHPLWERGDLAFVHASGSPDPTRSHFDAQDFMESGTPGRRSTPDGWMNRLLTALPGPESPTRALSLGAAPSRILAGKARVASLRPGPRALETNAIDAPAMQAALSRLYAQDAGMQQGLRQATEGRSEMQRSMATDPAPGSEGGSQAASQIGSQAGPMMGDPGADAGAVTATGFAADAYRMGRLIHANRATQLAFTAVGGWDTHFNQGGARGQLANRLSSLAEGLDALTKGLGDSYRRTVIVVLSEFGRTLRQNGTGGTDHGRGNVIWLLGGAVAGGRMLGEWPGLDRSALIEGRDLAVITDFRAVLSPLLQAHLQASDSVMTEVFPNYTGGELRDRVLKS